MLDSDLAVSTVLYIILALINVISLITLARTSKLSPMYLLIETMILLDIMELIAREIHDVPVTIIGVEIYSKFITK